MNSIYRRQKSYISFLKVGERQYMEDLINEGTVFCKPIYYFQNIESKDLRGDENEGASHLEQISDLEVRFIEQVIGKADQGHLYLRNPNEQGNIYCLYGIETHTLDKESKQRMKLNLNMSGLSFGDTAVLIFDTREFINRVQKAFELEGLNSECSPVIYYDHKTFNGKLTPFHKSSKYACQNEVRFWIPNMLNRDLTIKIGNMSDISYLLPKEKTDSLYYQAL